MFILGAHSFLVVDRFIRQQSSTGWYWPITDILISAYLLADVCFFKCFFNLFFCVCAGGCHRSWGRASERSCSCQMFIRLLLLIWQTTSLRDSKGLCSRSTWLMPLFFFYFLTHWLVIVILQPRLIKRLGLWESRSVTDFSHTATFSSAKWVLRHQVSLQFGSFWLKKPYFSSLIKASCLTENTDHCNPELPYWYVNQIPSLTVTCT